MQDKYCFINGRWYRTGLQRIYPQLPDEDLDTFLKRIAGEFRQFKEVVVKGVFRSDGNTPTWHIQVAHAPKRILKRRGKRGDRSTSYGSQHNNT